MYCKLFSKYHALLEDCMKCFSPFLKFRQTTVFFSSNNAFAVHIKHVSYIDAFQSTEKLICCMGLTPFPQGIAYI